MMSKFLSSSNRQHEMKSCQSRIFFLPNHHLPGWGERDSAETGEMGLMARPANDGVEVEADAADAAAAAILDMTPLAGKAKAPAPEVGKAADL